MIDEHTTDQYSLDIAMIIFRLFFYMLLTRTRNNLIERYVTPYVQQAAREALTNHRRATFSLYNTAMYPTFPTYPNPFFQTTHSPYRQTTPSQFGWRIFCEIPLSYPLLRLRFTDPSWNHMPRQEFTFRTIQRFPNELLGQIQEACIPIYEATHFLADNTEWLSFGDRTGFRVIGERLYDEENFTWFAFSQRQGAPRFHIAHGRRFRRNGTGTEVKRSEEPSGKEEKEKESRKRKRDQD